MVPLFEELREAVGRQIIFIPHPLKGYLRGWVCDIGIPYMYMRDAIGE
jgi:hypothetical protein